MAIIVGTICFAMLKVQKWHILISNECWSSGYDFNQRLDHLISVLVITKNCSNLVRYNGKTTKWQGYHSRISKRTFYGRLDNWLYSICYGIIPLGVGTFSQKTGDRMTNLWMYAINRYDGDAKIKYA